MIRLEDATMQVERVKYVIWAADMERAVRFWRDTFGGRTSSTIP